MFKTLAIVISLSIPVVFAQNQNKTGCDKYIPTGNLFYSQEKYDQAYVAFRACILLEPKNTQALYFLARTETKLNLFSAAINHLNEVINLDSRQVTAYVALADAYTQQYLASSDRKTAISQLEAALRTLDDADRLASKAADKGAVSNQRALIYKYRGDTAKALEEYKKAAALLPNDPTIAFNLGVLQLDLGQITPAVNSLQIAVEADPKDFINRAYLAKALRMANNLNEARSQALQAYNSSSIAQDSPFVAGQVGIVYYYLKDLTRAKTYLLRSTELPASVAYHENFFYLGRVYLDSGSTKDAKAALTKATALQPQEETYWFYLGRANESLGDTAGAKAAYQQALKIKPDYKEAKDALSKLR